MKKECLNKNWKFFKEVSSYEKLSTGKSIDINLPHTWNNLDGQDGGNDYYRGVCFYTKELNIAKQKNKVYYLEFHGVNSIAEVFVNGKLATHHEGGFSTFRANITDLIVDGKNNIAVSADNSENNKVYPQMADFTFFGGIYRSVYLIEANESRFDLDYYGGTGVTVTPEVQKDGSADVKVQAYITNAKANQKLTVKILYDNNQVVSGETEASNGNVNLLIKNPNFWNGVENPCLYKAVVELIENGNPIDRREITFGIRTFSVDKDGFVLNGKRYPLYGVSRHQDRLNMGWAITKKEHKEDMDLIAEVGANTVRLAHYQHDQYFYDLANEYGMVVWAEIPYISEHMSSGNENAISQMKELIIQNYNHPSIMFWGISNEITIVGENDEIYAVHHQLNDICHELDKTRLTTIANVTMLETSSPLVNISDIMAYNHYFGWYIGAVEDNATWIDDFRKTYPDKPIGISEYGCEAILTWHNSNPKQGDYSEEYQSYYHENMLKIFSERPYLWSTYVWNMFDFGVDGRDEGGVKGRNNKGLVTYDRKTKKDSFYIYKAYWTSEPFVHITSKRYFKRAERVTKVKVYTNQSSVTLFVNDKKLATKSGKYVFEFDVPLKLIGTTKIVAESGNVKDECQLKRVLKPHSDYILKSGADENATNWFEKDGVKYEFKYPEGKFSIKDKLSVIMAKPEGEALIMKLIDEALNQMKKEGEQPMQISKSMFKLAGTMTIERIAGMAGNRITPELLYQVNEELNKIAK